MVERRIDLIERAASTFPFRYYLRTSPGYAAILLRLPAAQALPLIERSLKDFPNAADLNLHKWEWQLQLGQYAEAAVTFERLHQLVPMTPFVKQLCGSQKDCKVQFMAAQQ